jgi:ribosomal-protein-serine acetyltransferase
VQLSRNRWLRLLDDSDAEELYALVAANREYLARWLPWAAGQTPEDTSAFIQRTLRQLARNDGFQTAIVEDQAIIGIVGFHGVNWQNCATTIGYWLAESAQGRGIMTCAVRVLVDHALAVWRLDRVEIRAAVDNARSRAIPERLGFSLEGVLRGAEVVGGRSLDHAIYAIAAYPNRGS